MIRQKTLTSDVCPAFLMSKSLDVVFERLWCRCESRVVVVGEMGMNEARM